MKAKDLLKLTGLPVLAASLCCLSPIVLVLLGVGTSAFAASLSDVLYGQYKWIFRAVGLILLSISVFLYFRSRGVCSLAEAKRRRNEILNTVLLVLITAVIGYIVFLYGILEIIGRWLRIWD